MGQIATFIDSLHLTYDEVVYKIPYRNLVIMQRDKMRAVYNSEVMQEVTEEEFFKGKGMKFSKE